MKCSNRHWLPLICLVLGVILLLKPTPGQTQDRPSQKPRATILEFSRELCPMCEYMKKALGQVKAKYGDQIEIRLIHYEPDEKLFKQYKVVFVPTQVFLDPSGKEVFRQSGVFTEHELVKKLKELKLIETP